MRIICCAALCAITSVSLGQAIDIFGGQVQNQGQTGQPVQQPPQPGAQPNAISDWQADVQPGLMAQMAGANIANLGAPDWCKPGVRLTYYAAAASVAQSGYQLIEDPNGNWEDPRTGKKYRKTDENPKPGDTGGGSGDGFSQVDIISVGRNAVAANTTMYTINRTKEPPDLVTTPSGGFVASAVSPGDTWIHPKALVAIQQANAPGFMILKGRVTFDNQPVDALCIVNQNGDAYASYTYDLRTGLLLQHSTATSSKTGTVHIPGSPPPAGNMQLTYTKFVSMRQVKLPVGGPLPPGVQKEKTLRYIGHTTWVNPVGGEAAGKLRYPTLLKMTVDQAGPSWALVKIEVSSTVADVPQRSEINVMAGGFSNVWIHPAILAQLKPNTVLDEDPITKTKIMVNSVANGRVAIGSQGSGDSSEFIYDANTGQLISLVLQVPSSGTTTEVELIKR